MGNNVYIAYLNEKYKEKPDALAKNMEVIDDFHVFLNNVKSTEKPIYVEQKDVVAYVIKKREHSESISEIIGILADYALFLRDETFATETILLQDALGEVDVIKKMSGLTKEYCPDAWEQIFRDVKMPQVGWTMDEMSDFSRETEKKMLAMMPREQYEHIMCKNAHDWHSDWNSHLQMRFLSMKSLDQYINSLNDDMVKSLEKSRDNGTLCFTQKADDETVAYVKANPEYTRQGNKVHVVKTPFLINKYLHETDSKMKRYYSCHCPLIRSSILQEEGPVSHSFCYCSLGYVKKPFDIAFDREITGRVIKTAMDEDSQGCIFELDMPEDIMEQYT